MSHLKQSIMIDAFPVDLVIHLQARQFVLVVLTPLPCMLQFRSKLSPRNRQMHEVFMRDFGLVPLERCFQESCNCIFQP